MRDFHILTKVDLVEMAEVGHHFQLRTSVSPFSLAVSLTFRLVPILCSDLCKTIP